MDAHLFFADTKLLVFHGYVFIFHTRAFVSMDTNLFFHGYAFIVHGRAFISRGHEHVVFMFTWICIYFSLKVHVFFRGHEHIF